MKQEDTTNITARCFHGEPASCSHACPFFFDIRTFLARAAAGRFGLAYKLYRNAAVFPAIVSELCEAPCRGECQRGGGPSPFFTGDEPVDVRAVEAAAVRFAKDRRPETFRIPPREQRIAVVGAGLSGLSVALNMAQKAYPVTVFERGEELLWSWRNHVKYEYFLEEVKLQFSAVQAEFVFNREIVLPDDSALEGFAYVYNATDSGGADPVKVIAAGIETSKYIETYLQSGAYGNLRRDEAGGGAPPAIVLTEKQYVGHADEESKRLVVPADPAAGYTQEEAAEEAGRCMGCDCRACMDACAMLGRYNKRPQKIALEAYADTMSAPPFSSCTLTRETYSCNLCGYCKSVCPVNVDLEKLFHIARTGRAETGKHPKAFHNFWLRDFNWHRTTGAYFSPPLLQETGGDAAIRKYMFFPGCKLGARSPEQVRSAAEFLKQDCGAGILLDCCGAPAYWAGEEVIFREHIESLREKWEEAERPVFIFACLYCMRLFGEFLPEIEAVSVYEILENSSHRRDARGGFVAFATRLPLRGVPCEGQSDACGFAVFDPCMARDFPEAEKAVRKLAEGAGISLAELPDKNRCCGFGGHMRVANPGVYDTVAEDAAAESEAPYIVYCANCAETFKLQGKEHVHVLDIILRQDAEVKPDNAEGSGIDNISVGDAALGVPPAMLQARRNNAIQTKTILMDLYGGAAFTPEQRPWDALNLDISAELLEEMDRRLILEDDVKEAIYEAERSGEFFILPEGGPDGAEMRQACLVRDVVTIWVQWTPAYNVTGIWSHRMRFSGNE